MRIKAALRSSSPSGRGESRSLFLVRASTSPGSNCQRTWSVVFNAIYDILTQQDQVRCFESAARHLTDDGVFVVEAGVPSAWIRRDQFINVEHVEVDEVVLDVNRYDSVTQILEENHVSLSNEGVRLGPISCRVIWPSEMDLMVRIAGLRLVDRWGGWRNDPFTATSVRHISVYSR